MDQNVSMFLEENSQVCVRLAWLHHVASTFTKLDYFCQRSEPFVLPLDSMPLRHTLCFYDRLTTVPQHLRDFQPPYLHSWPPPVIALQPTLLAITTCQDDLPASCQTYTHSTADIPFLIIQHIRRHPLHTEPMPNQTYFTHTAETPCCWTAW